MKGGELSPAYFDKLNSQLNVANADNKQKDLQITQLSADLKRTKDALLDFHSQMIKLDSSAKYQTSTLQELVDTKIREQSNRIQLVTETFKDALMLSNKTYFLEEMTKQKNEKRQLKKELTVWQSKVAMLQD